MNAIQEIALMVKSAGWRSTSGMKLEGRIVPGKRPEAGELSNTNKYSDAGSFYDYISNTRPTAKIYIRPDSPGRRGNVGVATPDRWNSDEVDRMAEEMYRSDLTSGAISGLEIPRSQMTQEIVSHDSMDPDGGLRPGVLSSITSPLMRYIGEIVKDEKNPAQSSDVRGLPKFRMNSPSSLWAWAQRAGHWLNSKAYALDESIAEHGMNRRIPSVGMPGMTP